MQTSGNGDARNAAQDSRIEVSVTTDTSQAPPHKAGEAKLYVMRDAADPDGEKLYFTQAEWDAFTAGVKDGEFDLDDSGDLPPIDLARALPSPIPRTLRRCRRSRPIACITCIARTTVNAVSTGKAGDDR